jgi:nitrous oxidase accessory protein NosD
LKLPDGSVLYRLANRGKTVAVTGRHNCSYLKTEAHFFETCSFRDVREAHMALVRITAVFFLFSSLCFSTTVFVPGDHPTIQAAIDALATGDTVIVRPGTYAENIDFLGKAITVMSEQGAAVTTIDGNRSGSVVTFRNGEGPFSILEGFTVTNGTGDVSGPYGRGGGIYCESSSPTISNNTITRNTTCNYGGGIYCGANSSPSIIHNTIIRNTADFAGGGVCCYYSSPVITDNTVSNNSATGSHSYGGGLYCYGDSRPLVTRNIIYENSGNQYGGGVHCGYYSNAEITNNIVTNNRAVYAGGGICCLDHSPARISNNIISGNSSDYEGGGVCFKYAFPTVANNTIYDNIASDHGGGISCGEFSNLTVASSILWHNTSSSGAEIWIGNKYYPTFLAITHSDVQGGQSSIFVDTACTLNWGPGMIEVDPLFADAPNDDFHLTWQSPCRDAGDDATVTELHDFEGDPRTALGAVDMGADEFYPHLYLAGETVPSSFVSIRVVGPPGGWVRLLRGSGVLDPPLQTKYGFMYLQQPLVNNRLLGKIPVEGVLKVPAMVPPHWLPATEYPYQAIIGPVAPLPAMLTNLFVVRVH